LCQDSLWLQFYGIRERVLKMIGFANSQIISVKKENNEVSSFTIHPVPDGFSSRKAGQYLLLKLPKGNGWSEAHPFTITSSGSGDVLKITVKRVGDFTTALHSITTPVDVQISGPLGNFGKTIDEESKIVFIAGGIGITPFLSLLMHLDEKKSNAGITLFWANNKLEEFFALDFLNDLSIRLNIKIIVVSFEPNSEKGLNDSNLIWKSGHLTGAMFEEFIEEKNSKIYMCGSENMQKYVFSQIKGLGIEPENVETEKIGIYMKSKTEN